MKNPGLKDKQRKNIKDIEKTIRDEKCVIRGPKEIKTSTKGSRKSITNSVN